MVQSLKNKVTQRINSLFLICCGLFTLLNMQSHAAALDSLRDNVEGTEKIADTSAISADPFASFAAEYYAYRYGKKLGSANLALTQLKDNQYRLDYSSSLSIFFLSDKRKETSFFAVENDTIIPLSYEFIRTGTGSDKHTRVKFDHDKGKILVNERPAFPLEDQLDNQLYRLDIQSQLAKGKTEFDYGVINDKGEYREYHMQSIGLESVELPFGDVKAIKIGIIRQNSSRKTYAWFAPSLNYLLVRLQQFKDGDEQGDIKLSHYSTSS